MARPMNSSVATNLVLASISVVILVIVLNAPVRQTKSDSKGVLLLSQAIIQHGAFNLDEYTEYRARYRYRMYEKNGHLLYYFPLGTPLLSIPFVAVLNAFGHDMLQYDSAAQTQLAAIVSVIIFWLMYLIARLYMSEMKSTVLATIFWFGTPLASTLGTALWSHNYAVLFSLLALLFALGLTSKTRLSVCVVIALCLFAAYLSRPTQALFGLAVILLVYVRDRKSAVVVGAVFGSLILGFVAFSYSQFQQPLPDYYLPNRLAGGEFIKGLYGNMISPGRGLFIYCPFLVLPLVLLKHSASRVKQVKGAVFIVLWPLLHLASISSFPHWWAGCTYGPRLMSDAIPGLFVLCALSFSGRVPMKPAVWAIGICAAVFAVYVNTVQGLTNIYTLRWQSEPSIDRCPEDLFEWEFPPFLHNEKRHQERILLKRLGDELEVISAGEQVEFTSEKVVFNGWSVLEAKQRWSLDRQSQIYFAWSHDSRLPEQMALRFRTNGAQLIEIHINDQRIDEFRADSWDTVATFAIESSLIHRDKPNSIRFVFPEARQPGNGDPRTLALAILWFTFE